MKRFTLLLLFIVAVACVVETPRDSRDGDPDAGRSDSGDVGGGDDGGRVDGGDVDAGEDDAGSSDGGPVVYPRKWGPPIHLAELGSSARDWLPSMTDDMLRICFASDRNRTPWLNDIYCASRDNVGESFGTPVLQANVNTDQNEQMPVIWKDELYFSSNRSGSYKVYRATWNTVAGTYSTPTMVAELSSAADEVLTSIAPDGLSAFLQTTRAGSIGKDDIYISTRASTSAPWGTPLNVSSLNTTDEDWAASAAPDFSFLLFISDRADKNGNHPWAWFAERDPQSGWRNIAPADIKAPAPFRVLSAHVLPNGWLIGSGDPQQTSDFELYLFPPRGEDPPPKFQWGTPVPITELNTSSIDAQPTMTADMLRICFASDRAGGLGQLDIWCATRTSTSSPFGSPTNLSTINSSAGDDHPELSSDGAELFFQSGRSGKGAIYRAVWVPAENTFKFPEPVTAINSSGETGPALTSDDLVILFASVRAGGAGEEDLYLATRPDRASSFGTPMPLTGLNSAYLDNSPAPSKDGYTLVFSSRRPSGNEQGVQVSRIWGVDWIGNGQWGTPELVEFDNLKNESFYGAFVTSDGSLLTHRDGPSKGDIYIAPPK
jgi:Tol biopolymer transport system component